MMKDMPNFEIPAHMRQVAEQSVDQAKKAVDGFMAAAHKTMASLESQASAAQANAKDIGQRAMVFAEQNVASSFEFAQKLVRAKDLQEVMALQAEFAKTQMQAFTTQAKEMGETASKAAMDASKPKL
jgi:phasin